MYNNENMDDLFKVGDIIYGYCNGYFGRDDYDTKVCIMATPLYAVFEYTEGYYQGTATVLNYKNDITSLKEIISDWKINHN